MNKNTKAPRIDLRALLLRDHERLEGLFEQLLEAFRANAREDAARLWSLFDDGLRTHLELEERHILPAFAEFAPEEAAALIQEHDDIRTQLTALGVGVDLHLTRDNAVEAFVQTLRDHAQREDALLYRWADEHLSADNRENVGGRLVEVARRFVHGQRLV